MEKLARILITMIGALLLLGALGFMFAPAMMEPDFSVILSRLDGWGTLRADVGGPFLAIALFAVYGARRGNSRWIWVPLIFMTTFLFGRTVHLVVDGVSQPAIRSYLIEVILLAVLIASRRTLVKVDSEPSARS